MGFFEGHTSVYHKKLSARVRGGNHQSCLKVSWIRTKVIEAEGAHNRSRYNAGKTHFCTSCKKTDMRISLEQIFSNREWASGRAFIQSIVTATLSGCTEDVLYAKLDLTNFQFKYRNCSTWIFLGSIFEGMKGKLRLLEKWLRNMN